MDGHRVVSVPRTFFTEGSLMLSARGSSQVSHRDGRSRPRKQAFRPRSERLEERALLSLFPGNPLQETPQTFTGVGTTNSAAALNSFEATIGGSANKTAAPQSGGFRTINWDG